MKIATIVGARPQFIKASAVSRYITDHHANDIEEVLIHTGQHHDDNMSEIFFQQLGIPQPKHHLNISGGSHGDMTGRMLSAIEKLLLVEKPDTVIVYGDTNSTLAGALAATKLHIPIAHVEAGLRSFNMRMPEEINRILTDRISTYLLCPTKEAIKNLGNDGIKQGVYNVGDVMYDAALYFSKQAEQKGTILKRLELTKQKYILATCHRAENTDDHERLSGIMLALAELAKELPVVFPMHPRTRTFISQYKLEKFLQNLCILEPLPYLEMVALERNAHAILTDSGGIQKEAFFYGVPCITMRDETEWIETIDLGWNQLVGADTNKIKSATIRADKGCDNSLPYGDGTSSMQIINTLLYT